MRTLALTLAAIILGFFAGMVLSQVIGILGFVLLHRPVGIPYLSIITAGSCAVLVLATDALLRRRSR